MKESNHHRDRYSGTGETSLKGSGNGFSSAAFFADIIRTPQCRAAIDGMLSDAMGYGARKKSLKVLLIRAIRYM